MFWNLEKHREPEIKAAEKSTQTDCVCICKKTSEKGTAEKPGPDQTAAGMRLHYDING